MDARRPKTFCIGLGRTGTTTFGTVMEQFGYAHKTGPVQLGLIYAELGDLDRFFPLVESYDSFADFPYPKIFRDCVERYPESRYVLTRRSSPEKWVKSLAKHNLRKGPTDANFMTYGCYIATGHEARLTQIYLDHLDDVRRYFAGTGRLVEVCWEEPGALDALAEFVGYDGPEFDVPVVNSEAGKDPKAIIDRLIGDTRIGAAIAYARSRDDAAEWLDYIRGAEADWGVKWLPKPPRRWTWPLQRREKSGRAR